MEAMRQCKGSPIKRDEDLDQAGSAATHPGKNHSVPATSTVALKRLGNDAAANARRPLIHSRL